MVDKTWKAAERRIAKLFDTERTPLSGSNGKVTASDTLHPKLFIEAKKRKKHSVITLYDETKAKAAKEGKIAVIALTVNGRPGVWLMCKAKDFKKVASFLKEEKDER